MFPFLFPSSSFLPVFLYRKFGSHKSIFSHHSSSLIPQIEQIGSLFIREIVNIDGYDSNLTHGLPFHNIHGRDVGDGDEVALLRHARAQTKSHFVHSISRGRLLAAFLLSERQPLAFEVCWLQALLSFSSLHPP